MAKEKTNGAAHDDEIEIELDPVVAEKPAEGEIKVAEQEDKPVIASDPPPAAVPAEDGIETLKANLERERQGRLNAEEDARKARTETANAGKTVQETNLALVTNAIANTNAAIDRMESDYAQALQDGDHAAAAKINRAMSQSMSELSQLESGKTALEAEAKNPRREESRVENDPVEFIARQLSPKSAQWVRDHPDHATGQKFNAMVAADQLARARGFAADSDEYFADVEDTLKIRRREPEPERETALSEAAEGVRRQSPASAPVSRGGGMDGQKKPGTVRLSAAEVEMAQNMGQSVEEYAREKQALISEGKLN